MNKHEVAAHVVWKAGGGVIGALKRHETVGAAVWMVVTLAGFNFRGEEREGGKKWGWLEGLLGWQRRWMGKPHYICKQNEDAQYSKKVYVCAHTKSMLQIQVVRPKTPVGEVVLNKI